MYYYFRSYIVIIIVYVSIVYASKPHIVFIVADDLGWNDVGFHGSDQILTPNIDALAYCGTILQKYYVLPVCTPSRSALMTGMHPINIGMQHRVLFAGEPWGLPLRLKLLPQYLKENGYKTYAIGKWHLGHYKSEYTPEMRGFDSHFGYWSGRQDYYDHTAQEMNTWGYDMRRGMNISWESFGHYTTDLIGDEAIKKIDSHDTRNPLFLYVAHLAVHSANMYKFLEAPQIIVDKFDYIKDENRRIFAAMLWKLDESVGKIVAALDQKGILDNTIIVFTSDNGGPAAGFNSNAASNWPLRGVKDTLWEGGVRGSALIWGKNLPHSVINNDLMHIQDWLPTILAAINNTNTHNIFDGHNMWPSLTDEKHEIYDEIILNIDQLRNVSALRKGDWKIIKGQLYNGRWNGWYGPSGKSSELKYDIELVRNSSVANAFKRNSLYFPTNQTIYTIRKKASVLCEMSSNDKPCDLEKEICLYNVVEDPCERINKAFDEPNILREMLDALAKYKPVEPLNKPVDPRSNPKYWNYTWTNWMDYV